MKKTKKWLKGYKNIILFDEKEQVYEIFNEVQLLIGTRKTEKGAIRLLKNYIKNM